MSQRTCKVCENVFASARYRAYCSDDCRKESDRRRVAAYRETCEYREWYKARLATGKYAETNRIVRQARRIVRVEQCRYCRESFEVLGTQRQVVCQSADCKYHFARDRTSLALARRSGVPIGEPFTYLEVLERDAWVCGICGEAISQDASFPDKDCATVDHVIPLRRGGPHDLKNVQAAHFSCNSRKADSEWFL